MNRDQLTRAHRASGLAGSLDEAMANPLLAKCLEITAAAIGRVDASMPRPAHAPAPAAPTNSKHPAARDFKRASAGDQED